MAEKVTPISRALSDELTGAYSKKRLTQEEIARRADMSIVTLQKKLRGRAPISATDLVILSYAIGVDPAQVLTDALEELAKPASDGPASLDAHRKKKTPAEMTDEEMECERSAANTDPEIGHDEPDAP